MDSGVKIFETLPSMANHGPTEGLERFFTDFDRPRNVKFCVSHNSGGNFHEAVSAGKRSFFQPM
jgi:hypothetical protein